MALEGKVDRRSVLWGLAALGGAAACGDTASEAPPGLPPAPSPVSAPSIRGFAVRELLPGETLFTYMDNVHGGFDRAVLGKLLGAANPFKEGDQAQGLAAADEPSRLRARELLAATTLGDYVARCVFEDEVQAYADAAVDAEIRARLATWTFASLKAFLLEKDEAEIHAIKAGLTSDVIGAVVKLMTNDELVAVGQKVFNPLPGSKVGAKGYLGARVQPNSPTDHPDDIVLQVLDAFSYAVGDALLGTNPVSSEVDQVAAVELALRDLLATFGLSEIMPHCVLAHVDVQAAVEAAHPGSTALWFQSLAGVADANRVFDIDVAKMVAHSKSRTGPFGMYFETGQGADGTNGQAKGFDMVLHESRKYGFARALAREVAAARAAAGHPGEPWVHVNDVAGFIGPEVFRTKEQLVRVCLEDTVMGKLHGLTHGLDVCSTLHMEVSLDDLDWCVDQIMPANPGYLMALPTKNDPMLSYLTTSFQDHVRIREKFGYKVDDRMWAFFKRLGVLDAEGRPTEHFGDPAYVWVQYQRAKGDQRDDRALHEEAQQRIAGARSRGVPIASGHGAKIWDLEPALDQEIRALYADAKTCLFSELPKDFALGLPGAIPIVTRSADRHDYILHPPSGEALSDEAVADVRRLKGARADRYAAQIVISDGLDALSLTDPGHLAPFLEALQKSLVAAGLSVDPDPLVVTWGRVRAGYAIGQLLFSDLPDPQKAASVVHIIGERPGNGHHTFSVYLTRATGEAWAQGAVDHHLTRVVANIADTAFKPAEAAAEAVMILGRMAP